MIFQGVKLYSYKQTHVGGSWNDKMLSRDILELIKKKKKNLHLCPVISFQQDPVDVYTI